MLRPLKDSVEDDAGGRKGSLSMQPRGKTVKTPKETDATLDAMAKKMNNKKSAARLPVNVSLFVNILLFAAKIYVYIDSFSLSVLASLVDSFMDLLSQAVIYWTERNMTKQHPMYPVGRTRLEPIGIMTLSTLMIMSAIMIIREATEALLANHHLQDFNYFAIGSMSSVIVLKFICWLFCRSYQDQPIALALAEDHINDVLSNSVALAAAVVSFYVPSVYYVDGIGSIVISLYIIYSWLGVGKEELRKVVGVQAEDEKIEQIKEICHQYELKNDDKWDNEKKYSINLDVLRAYHIGRNLLVEIEIVMPPYTTLKISHDTCLALQQDIEKLAFVERAFVHVDYQYRHEDEHKLPSLA